MINQCLIKFFNSRFSSSEKGNAFCNEPTWKCHTCQKPIVKARINVNSFSESQRYLLCTCKLKNKIKRPEYNDQEAKQNDNNHKQQDVNNNQNNNRAHRNQNQKNDDQNNNEQEDQQQIDDIQDIYQENGHEQQNSSPNVSNDEQDDSGAEFQGENPKNLQGYIQNSSYQNNALEGLWAQQFVTLEQFNSFRNDVNSQFTNLNKEIKKIQEDMKMLLANKNNNN